MSIYLLNKAQLAKTISVAFIDHKMMSSQGYFNTNFCILLANQILLKQAQKGFNFVASPFSLHVVLSQAAAGSRGHTLNQLLSFLGSKSVQDLNLKSSQIIALTSLLNKNEDSASAAPILSFINGAWIDKKFNFKPCFEDLVRNVYKANVKQVDFVTKAHEVVQEVNSWAENESRGLIKELLPSESLDKDTALVLANALYFKGSWNIKFDTSKTETRDFHLLNGDIVRAPFMTSKKDERHFFRDTFEDYKVLQIPYQSIQESIKFSIYFFLPNDKHGLQNLLQTMNSQPGFLNQDFGLWQEEVTHFWIPKFKFSSEFEASEEMKELGLTLPFTGSGEFTEIVDCENSEKLCVSGIFHKSFIEVNEEGTEAAASTALTMRWCCASSYVPSFVADHPFVFMIREETHKTVFFVGSVINPLLAS